MHRSTQHSQQLQNGCMVPATGIWAFWAVSSPFQPAVSEAVSGDRQPGHQQAGRRNDLPSPSPSVAVAFPLCRVTQPVLQERSHIAKGELTTLGLTAPTTGSLSFRMEALVFGEVCILLSPRWQVSAFSVLNSAQSSVHFLILILHTLL